MGIKQGYKIGNFQGFVDVAGFYTQYKDMVEFQFGLFNNADYTMINSIGDAVRMLTDGQGFGIGAQFHNVSKAQIYGVEISTNGVAISGRVSFHRPRSAFGSTMRACAPNNTE